MLTVYFDGACEPTNPGGVATCGWRVLRGEEVLAEGSAWVGTGTVSNPDGLPGLGAVAGERTTNNVAEYAGLIHGLTLAWGQHEQGEPILVRGDSKLVCEQVAGGWACNQPHLRLLRDYCSELLMRLDGKVRIEWVPRDDNAEADALTRAAYEKYTGKPFPVRTPRRVRP